MKNLPAAIFSALLLLSAVPATAQYTISFDNQNSTNIPNFWVTFIGGDPGATLNGPGGTAIVSGTSYQVTASNTVSMSSTAWSGHIYISDADLGGSNTDPTFTDTSLLTRFSEIETAGSSTIASPDISYINYYGTLPISMTNNTTPATRGTVVAGADLSTLPQKLANLSTDQSLTVVKNGSNQIVRVIGPNTGNGAQQWLASYPTFTNYLNATFPTATPITSVQLTNLYDGVQSPPSVLYQQQNYTNTNISYDGATLTIKEYSNLLGNMTMTSAVTTSQLSDDIYLSVLTYDWAYDGQGTTIIAPDSGTGGNTGDNTVFSAVARDLAAGFQSGFIGSTAEGGNTSQEWMQALALFSQIQSNSDNYNQWGSELYAAFEQVYGYPFSDFLANLPPEMNVNIGDNFTITLLDTSPVPEPATVALFGLSGIALLLYKRRAKKA